MPPRIPTDGRQPGTRIPRSGIVGASVLLIVVALCVFVPIVSPYPVDAFVGSPFQAPSSSHFFGTDAFGRDVFTRVFAGGRVDLLIAVIGVSVPLVIGTTVGILMAVTQIRWVDAVLVRLIDAMIAFPFVVLVLALVVLFGADRALGPLPAGMPALLAAVFVVSWTIYARLSRAETLTLRERDYIVAVRLLGYSTPRIVFKHLLPQVLGTTATYAVSDAVLLVVATASLPFLGAGIQPPNPEWGSIMYEGRTVLADSWWITVTPGLVLIAFGMGLTLLADAAINRREDAS